VEAVLEVQGPVPEAEEALEEAELHWAVLEPEEALGVQDPVPEVEEALEEAELHWAVLEVEVGLQQLQRAELVVLEEQERQIRCLPSFPCTLSCALQA
jgi:hypothetical protein